MRWGNDTDSGSWAGDAENEFLILGNFVTAQDILIYIAQSLLVLHRGKQSVADTFCEKASILRGDAEEVDR